MKNKKDHVKFTYLVPRDIGGKALKKYLDGEWILPTKIVSAEDIKRRLKKSQ